ncbi:ABC transporter ATP-binding protein [Aeromonas veronii]|uniref:ABC transporter ATP-binding protein n=1 Tax=Aeromonas veronii TaxID=654 RepID=UPI0024449296|nr:ABC transporter ATP-binding protein [Aeromonas veronii]
MSLSYPPSCLQVINVSKTYRVFDTPSQRLKDLIGLNGRHQDVVALQNTSFSLVHGETVAIVGANGSGKSTLLQLICGTLTPSTGTIKRHGRIAALLELGAGFNPEFTGLENVFLNASINGLTQEQTEAILPDILAFADIGEHVYQPVKTYSSGMYVRLAFAVAIHVEPDILIIDEALAVGDEAFQRKCFARLRDLQSRGVSILFVSHSAESVVSLCDRALLLDHGQLLLDGPPRQVVAQYQKLLYARPEQREQVRAEIRNEGIAPQPVVVSASEPAFSSTPYHPDFFCRRTRGGMKPIMWKTGR